MLRRYNELEKPAEEEERLRLLYVATTRAKDHLILSGCRQRRGAESGAWMRLLAERFDLDSGAFLGNDGASAPVLVTTEAPPASRGKRSPTPRLDELGEQLNSTPPDSGCDLSAVGPLPFGAGRLRLSFSELSGILERDPIATADQITPTRTREEALRLGVLVHGVLAAWDWDQTSTKENISQAIARIDRTVSTSLSGEARHMLATFLQSEQAAAIAAATQRHAELEFHLQLPTAGEPVEMHGYLDMLYRDAEGRWCVVDYKTNVVAVEAIESAAEPYALQLYLYGLAVQRILGVEPHLSLYFLHSQRSYVAPSWSKLQRRCEPLLQQAIQKLRS